MALSGAERQAKWRAAHPAGAVRVRYRRPADRRSKADRWRDAVAELVGLQADYAAWLEALPPNQADAAIADTLRTIADLDLSEVQSVTLPRGYRPE